MTIYDLPLDNVFIDIQKTVAVQLGINTTTLEPGARFEDLDIDSLERVELGLQVEKQFGISLDDHQVRRCETLENLADLVRAAKSTSAGVLASALQEGSDATS